MKSLNEWMQESDNNQDSVRIFVDMDGVLCNFEKRFQDLNKEHLTSSEYESKYGDKSIWPIIDADGEAYWTEMPWMPDGQEMWQYVEKYNPTILSAPSRNPTSKSGKVQWLENHIKLPNYQVQTKAKQGWDGVSKIILNSDKWRYATGSMDVLIDDTPKKIDGWRHAGGTGILHTSAKSTIQELQKLNL